MIHVSCLGPTGTRRSRPSDQSHTDALAERYNKTVQQVALRYLVQRGIIAIPKSTHIERMKQNLDVFDFTLTPEDMESIRPLDKPADFRWSHRNPELVKFLLNYDKQFNPNNK
mgnify:CR=1 FL=1